MELTQKQKDFFEKLKEAYGKEPLPSYDKIAKDFGLKYKNSVWQYFSKLKEVDLLSEINGNFIINPDCFGAVKFSGAIRAGFAQANEDHINRRVSLDRDFDIDNPSTFMFDVSGDSMVELGIFDGDSVIVHKTQEARNGDIVVACIDGEFTLKTYRKKGAETYLEPANKNYPLLKPKFSLTVFGVAKGITRKL